jgi:hypothetical protein
VGNVRRVAETLGGSVMLENILASDRTGLRSLSEFRL